jgi:hypothetical protein
MNNLSAQSEELYKYANALLLNAWERKPDSIILEFVKKYIPVMISKETGIGSWSVISPPLDPVPQIPTLHATTFKKHPFFEGGYEDGEIQYLTLESDNKVNGISDIYLTLNYSNKLAAEIDLNKLQTKFDKPFFKKSIDSGMSVVNIRFSPLNEKIHLDTDIQIILYRDPIDPKNHKILFRFRHKDQD